MLDYLEKFNQLPQEIREKISKPETMAKVKELEEKYAVSLAMVIMRIMVKDISLLDLSKYFVFEYGMDARQSEKLVEELTGRILFGVADYLGIAKKNEVAVIDDKNDDKQLNNWMQEKKDETEARGSNFFFSAEDEKEVKELAKKLEDFKVNKTENQNKQLNYDNIINATTKEIGVNFSSEDLRKRFFGVMTTYLKGIRNKVDVKQALSKDINFGGLDFSEIYADNILVLADQKKIEEEKKQENIFSKGKEIAIESARDMDYDFKNMPSYAKATEGRPSTSKVFSHAKATDDRFSAIKVSSSAKVMEDKSEGELPINKEGKVLEKTIENKKEIFKPLKFKFEIAKQENLKRPETKSGKVKMDDVKHIPKLLGPIDELREMNLLNFRRLSDDSDGRIKKISEKIEFLEEENYARRLAGIKAWRQSELNKMYLDIGRESIGVNKGINVIINARQEKGEDCLSEEEFLTIMKLNKKLRY